LEQVLAEGADWVDIGGESTRPGAEPVSAEEEWRRIEPLFREARRQGFPLPLSVDTMKAGVAARALDQGAALVNDVSGLRFDQEMGPVVARAGAGLIVMHMQGEPRTMQRRPAYADVVREVRAALQDSLTLAEESGIPRERICVDPGIGFGKTDAHNFALLRGLTDLARLEQPILVGVSRKSFLGRLLELDVAQRLEGSLAANVAAVLAGAHIVRVHDVQATVRAVRVADALLA
jgi:dihydropteroate synthase